MIYPRVPGTVYPGKVRRRACGQHKSDWKNARKRGSTCPEALVCPEPERVCPKIGARPHKSFSSSSDEGEWKRGSTAQNPRCLSTGSLQKRRKTAHMNAFDPSLRAEQSRPGTFPS